MTESTDYHPLKFDKLCKFTYPSVSLAAVDGEKKAQRTALKAMRFDLQPITVSAEKVFLLA